MKASQIVTKAALGKISLSLHERPIVHITLVNTMLKGSWNVNLQCSKTLRCSWEFVCNSIVREKSK